MGWRLCGILGVIGSELERTTVQAEAKAQDVKKSVQQQTQPAVDQAYQAKDQATQKAKVGRDTTGGKRGKGVWWWRGLEKVD